MNTFLQSLAVSLVGDTSSSDSINIPKLTGEQVIHNSLNVAYFLAGTIAVIVIIVGGIMYATAAGNSGSVTKAKNLILYSVIGLVVIIIAFAVTNFVIVSFK